MSTPPVAPVGFEAGLSAISQLGIGSAAEVAQVSSQAVQGNFQQIMSAGIDNVNDKLATADELVRQFAVDDSIPVHQVTLALEEARLSVELAMQVRARMVETYREFMNMQL